MKLEVVWRNPEPPIKVDQTVERVHDDPSEVVYLVTEFDNTQEFTLLSGAVRENAAHLWSVVPRGARLVEPDDWFRHAQRLANKRQAFRIQNAGKPFRRNDGQ